jgi:putative nucleotidyltransferase with HDIG domain
MDDISKFLDRIEVLPPAPPLMPRLLSALADVDANFNEVVEMIVLDPSLTAKLLQICNSAFFGASEPVSNVREAVSQIGYQTIYLLVATINSSDCFQLPAAASLDGKRLWKHSVTTAYGAKLVAETAGIEPSLLFTAGLLHDIGKTILFRAHGEAYGLLRLRSAQAGKTPLQSEIDHYGYSHAEVGAFLLERWKLPALLVDGGRFHHRPAAAGDAQHIAACVALGNFLAHSQERADVGDSPDCQSTLALLNFTSTDWGRWQEQLLEYRSLVEMMSRLPA